MSVLNNFVIHKAIEEYTSTGVAGFVASLRDAGFAISRVDEITLLQAELADAALAHAKQAHDWLEQNGTPNALVAKLRAELAAANARCDTLAKEVAEWRSRPDALRADKAEADLAAANARVKELEAKIDNYDAIYQDEENRLRAELAAEQQNALNLLNAVGLLQSDLKQARAELAAAIHEKENRILERDEAESLLAKARADLAAERSMSKMLEQVICDTAEELGVEPDNEKMLLRAAKLKEQVAKLSEALVRARKYVFGFESQSDAGLLTAIDAVLKESGNE